MSDKYQDEYQGEDDEFDAAMSKKHQRNIAANKQVEISVDGNTIQVDPYEFLLKQINPNVSYWNSHKLVGTPGKKINSGSILADFEIGESKYPDFNIKDRSWMSSAALNMGFKKRGGTRK